MKITPKTLRLIDDLCNKAMDWGWEKDQGLWDKEKAEKDFKGAKQTLIDYLKAR